MDPITAALVATVASLAQRGLSLIAGAVMSKGKAVVEDKLGVKIDDMLATPEGTERLREIELDQQKLLNELAIAQGEQQLRMELARYADIASARAMQVEALKQDDTFSKRFVYWFIAGWSIFAMAFMVAVVFTELPHGNEQYAHTILGFLLATIVGTMFAYLLGTSRQSTLKDTTISALATKSA